MGKIKRLGENIIWGKSKDWEKIETEAHDIDEYGIDLSGIFLHKPSGKTYELEWRRASIGLSAESPFEYKNPKPIEVWAYKKETVVYTTEKPILKKESVKKKTLDITLLSSEDSYDYSTSHRLIVKDGAKIIREEGISPLSECPKDAIIGRDLIDGDDLINFIKLGYKAGKEGFELNFEYKDVDDIWEE